MKKLLWVGDAACPSGFARATREILETLQHHYDVTVLGMNYNGDPHPHSYPIYACFPGGDMFGVGRLIWMCDRFKPDVIVFQNDGWNIPFYVEHLARFPEYAKIPVVAAVAVDGKNFNGKWLAGISLAVFWTEFALKEARTGGYTGAGVVIPLGVDLDVYRPEDKTEARKKQGVGVFGDSFVVGNVNRNQPRKRWDLMLRYFAEWIHDGNIEDAFLYMHTAPTGDVGIDVTKLAKYYSVLDHLALAEPPVFYGNSEASMRDTFNCFDVYASTTQGEGMGLPAMEAMACGVPCVLPDWSAYGDWARDATLLVPCTSTCIGAPYQNVIGGVVDGKQFKDALDLLYRDRMARTRIASVGLARVHEPRFRWATIGEAWTSALHSVLE